MTYFKPIEATCPKCQSDKRRRIYRMRHDLGASKNRVTIFCEHSKPHYGPNGVEHDHVTKLLQAVRDPKRNPTTPTPCVQCGRIIQQRGWIRTDTRQQQIVDFLSEYPLPKNFVCGIECFRKLLAAQARARRNARPKTTCRFCSTSFTARRGAKYCSTRCRVAAHRQRQ